MILKHYSWYINKHATNICRYYDLVRDVRHNKGSILKASVDYIRLLKREKERKEALSERCKVQEQQNRKLLIKLQVTIVFILCFAAFAKHVRPSWPNIVQLSEL